MRLLYFLCFNFFAYCRKQDMIKNILLDAAKLHMHDYHTCKKEEKKTKHTSIARYSHEITATERTQT